ncbi:lipopolysaccharide assembly LapA domain-containing protein [Chroococcus sp. FPU101]|uniref:LapA family protein n=1 Tax=Chroococcus sp. FPU101 TaxID=1974212 RepID=UPI001A90B1DB|nr:hypothetical protein [Chroococcus sp. FPU101]
MRLIIFLLLLAVLGVFVVSNLQPVTLVFFGGSMIAKLPLSIWIIIFTGLGLVGSLVIQLLSNLFRPSRARVESFKPSPSPRPINPVEPKRQEPVYRSTSNAQDWNRSSYQSIPRDELDDWDIESPPAQTTPIRDIRTERIREQERIAYTAPSFVREPNEPIKEEKPLQELENTLTQPINETLKELKEDLNFRKKPTNEEQEQPEESINYEVPQSPQNVSRSGSVYSYTYRESTKSQAKSGERVYDADFRVIRPPNRDESDNLNQDPKNNDDDEDWV